MHHCTASCSWSLKHCHALMLSGDYFYVLMHIKYVSVVAVFLRFCLRSHVSYGFKPQWDACTIFSPFAVLSINAWIQECHSWFYEAITLVWRYHWLCVILLQCEHVLHILGLLIYLLLMTPPNNNIVYHSDRSQPDPKVWPCWIYLPHSSSWLIMVNNFCWAFMGSYVSIMYTISYWPRPICAHDA